MSADKIVFSCCQEDFDYCHNPEDILEILVSEVNAGLKDRGIDVEVVKEETNE